MSRVVGAARMGKRRLGKRRLVAADGFGEASIGKSREVEREWDAARCVVKVRRYATGGLG